MSAAAWPVPLDGWTGTSDRVMGGISRATVAVEDVAGRRWIRLTGRVRLENQGGFIQMATDLAPDGGPVDLSAYSGLRLLVRGNGERYGCHLRTTACVRPWQSYRQELVAGPVAAPDRPAVRELRARTGSRRRSSPPPCVG